MLQMTAHQKDQVLAVVAHYMDQDLRGKLMAEVPHAYNALVGSKVVKVSRVSDGREYNDPAGTDA